MATTAPEFAGPPRSYWSISTKTQGAGLYSLALIDLASFNSIVNTRDKALSDILPPVPVSAPRAYEFVFNINPKTMTLEEPAAVQIVPTQGGGQYIEHQGQIYKNITIAGTTGLRPNKTKPGGFVPVLNVQNPFADPDKDPQTGLPIGERTGFDDLLQLRNLFRAYWWLKTEPDFASTTVMIWQNGKEGEFYIVEPMSFKTNRDSSSPLTFVYEIQLRTIRRLDLRLPDIDPLKKINKGVYERAAEWTAKLSSAFTFVEALSDRTAAIGTATVDLVTKPLSIITNGLKNVQVSVTNTLSPITRGSVANLVRDALEAAANMADFQSDSDAYRSDGITTQQSLAVRTFRVIARTSASVAAESRLFSTTTDGAYARRANAYRNPTTGYPRTGGSPTHPSSVRASTGTGVETINGGDDIRVLALRTLGDAGAWRQLVILNDLKAPYISPSGDGVHVLRPGDEILYPRPTSKESTAISTNIDGTRVTSEVARLGRDIKLNTRGDNLWDVSIGNSGDIDIVEGLSNMTQAVRNRFATEQGRLPTHTSYGFTLPLGTKPKPRTLMQFKMNGRASLLADPRIADIPQLDLTVDGNVLTVEANIRLVGVDQGVSAAFDVRR